MDWELGDLAVDYARQGGASWAEARVEFAQVNSMTLRNGILDNVDVDEPQGLGVRVLVGGSMAFASTSRLERKEVKAAVDLALASARASRREHPLILGDARPLEVRWEAEQEQPFADLAVEDRLAEIQALDRAVTSTGLNMPGRLLTVTTKVMERYYATSEGARVRSRVPRLFLSAMLTAKEGSDVETGFRWLNYTGGWEGLRSLNPSEVLSHEAEVMHRALREGKRVEPGRMDVLCGPQVVGIASHESCGHPVEADRILGREASQAGTSFITPESVGERIGSEVVNVVDDPTVVHGGGFYLYDDEGVQARRRYLYKEGRIHELLHNRESAGILGMETNAAARTVGFNREPIVRMANTFVEPGDHSLEELLEDVRTGLYMVSFTEWNISDTRWNQKYTGREAYLIEDGEIGGPVRGPALEVTTRAFWSSVDAVGKDFYLEGGLCGKGDPMQGIEVSMGGPHVRLRAIPVR
jgi:TldD protein